ncbi:MAG: hypothetical protein EPO10_00150 [Reyranella sp.]|nr:MAG: hypothetical protein EPO41_25145 [Reyranella sp.]TBR30975.1 MAG: hypothetical protein EPO10_00150 [Reyranella sp.]
MLASLAANRGHLRWWQSGDATTAPYKQIVTAMDEGAKAALSECGHLIHSTPVNAKHFKCTRMGKPHNGEPSIEIALKTPSPLSNRPTNQSHSSSASS